VRAQQRSATALPVGGRTVVCLVSADHTVLCRATKAGGQSEIKDTRQGAVAAEVYMQRSSPAVAQINW
jgi:hypothetical protein